MTICPVERDTNRYLDRQAHAEAMHEAAEKLQDQLTTDFLTGETPHEETEEIFCDMTTSAQFAAALQKVFAEHLKTARLTCIKTSLGFALDDLLKICQDAAYPHFEKDATDQIEQTLSLGYEP